MLAMTLKLDHFVRAWIVMHRGPELSGVMWGLSVVGRGGLVWIAIAGLLGAAGRTEWRGLIQLALALLLTSTVVDHAVKPLVGRDRPFVSFPAAAVIGGRPD